MGRTRFYSDKSTIQRSAIASKLGDNEVTRRLWHFGPGFVALALTQAPGLDSISATAMLWMVILGSGLAAVALLYQKTFSRSHETNCIPAVIGYVAPVLLLMCSLPEYPELALALLGIVAFGDGSATLFGVLYGSARLPWNPQKTWVGTCAFVLVGVPMGMVIYQLTAVPHVSSLVALLCGAVAATCAGLMESLPLPGNDNLRTGTAAAAGLLLTHWLLVGFS